MLSGWPAFPVGRSLRLLVLLLLLPLPVAAQEPDAEGVPVRRVTFQGAEAVSPARLAGVMATRASSRLPFGRKQVFNRARFEADLGRIEAFYAARGFPDARVTSFAIELNDARDRVDLLVVVAEGEPVSTAHVAFEGFDELPPAAREALAGDAPLVAGQPLDRERLAETRERAANLLRDHGYPWPQVTVLEQPASDRPGHVAVTFRADPGVEAWFGPIEIVGNQHVSDTVVRRELLYRPGERFRRSLMQQSQRRLYQLELFDFANIQPIDTGEPSPEVLTRVTVAEGKPRRIEFSFGYGTEDRLRAKVDWRNRNFLGGARAAGLHAKWSSLDRGFRAEFREPYLFGSRVSFALTGHFWQEDEPAYRASTNGIRATVSRPMGGAVTASFSYSGEFTSSRISNAALSDLSLRDTLIALGLDPTTGVQDGMLSAVSIQVTRNTADSLLDPSRGSWLSGLVETAGGPLGGDFRHVNVSAEARGYRSVGERLVAAARLRFGSIRPAGGERDQVPFFKRYFLGGSTSLRGWGRYNVSPLSGSGLPLGGFTFLEGTAELRFALGANIGLVLFADAGDAESDAWRVDLGNLRYDVGPGFRYRTPIGPLRVDLGYQLTPLRGLLVNGEPEKRRWRIHFSIGQAF